MCVLACPLTGVVSSSSNGTSLIPRMIDWSVNLSWIMAPAYRMKGGDLNEHTPSHMMAEIRYGGGGNEASTYCFEFSVGEDPPLASLYHDADAFIRYEAGNCRRRNRAPSFPGASLVFTPYTQRDSSASRSRVSALWRRRPSTNKLTSMPHHARAC